MNSIIVDGIKVGRIKTVAARRDLDRRRVVGSCAGIQIKTHELKRIFAGTTLVPSAQKGPIQIESFINGQIRQIKFAWFTRIGVYVFWQNNTYVNDFEFEAESM